MINVRGQILPLVRLNRLFDTTGGKEDPTEGIVVIVEGGGWAQVGDERARVAAGEAVSGQGRSIVKRFAPSVSV